MTPVLRCFVGAFLVAADAGRLRRAAAAYSNALPARLVPAQNHHVTLKFLGDVPCARLEEVLGVVAALEAGPEVVKLEFLVGLPRQAAARLLAAEVAEHESLSRWQARLAAALGAEPRPFRPHVTVARWRRPRRVESCLLEPSLTAELAAPALYCSDRNQHGARYRLVSSADLAPSG